MRQKVYSIIVLLFFSICLFLFLSLYKSSLSLQDLKLNSSSSEIQQLDYQPRTHYSFFSDTYLNNPAHLEVYLRSSLTKFNVDTESNVNTEELLTLYKKLLLIRPTWPYYHSGLVQVDNYKNKFNLKNIENTIKHGMYERTVVNGLAEVLFHRWDNIPEKNRLKILNYLSDQHSLIIPRTINISSNFARLYQYCDFLYEKNNVEYAACKQNYWQPLTD